ncbi:hypothetical protein BAR24_09500 [Gluconobacter oxydans]|uniref:hypothetical protein n=1 Tax=Gluconobacter thailandicus TaxID=257438 RepID=UPI000299752F|nr:hypothetical protein [Gluconobacter thailandicus]AFW02909.1 hypothetical protein B932_3364 [Gluconobacter oxydans H24]ANQ41674.1 hypothetical protein BAR24_09500 [Gluconobacter oxydans]
MIRLFLRAFCIPAGFAIVATSQAAANERIIPTVFEAGHFYATPTALNGQKVRLLADTGGAGFGGLYVLKKSAVSRLNATLTKCKLDDFNIDVVRSVSFLPDAGLAPVTTTRPCMADAMSVDNKVGDDTFDGMLGAGYLARFIVTFDYPFHQLKVEPDDWRPAAGAEQIPLIFPHNAQGKRESDFPGVNLTIDGEPVHLLLDTGATAFPTPSGLAAQHIETVNGEGVTSYITKSVFDRWHSHHPEWQVVEHGDHLIPDTRIIMVPEVYFGTARVGPVWFTERPDKNFGPKGMSMWMGQTVVGAAGANIYGKLKITIDYAHEALWLSPSKK